MTTTIIIEITVLLSDNNNIIFSLNQPLIYYLTQGDFGF